MMIIIEIIQNNFPPESKISSYKSMDEIIVLDLFPHPIARPVAATCSIIIIYKS